MGVPWWPSGRGLSIVTAVVGVGSLAWEFPHGAGTAKKKKKNLIGRRIKMKNSLFFKKLFLNEYFYEGKKL